MASAQPTVDGDPSGTAQTGLLATLSTLAAEQPDALLLTTATDSRTLSRSDVLEAVDRWRSWLHHLPVGAVIGLRGQDALQLAVAWLGVVASGRCVAPLAPDLSSAAFTRWADQVQPWLVLDAEDYPVQGPGEELPARSEGNRQAAGVLLTSSGTTGAPKLVALTEAQLLHTAASVAAAHELGPQDRCYNPLPLWHINAEVVALCATLCSGGSLVLADRFHRTGFWQSVSASGATWLNLVPAIFAILGTEEPDPAPSGIRFARSASAPLPGTVQQAFESRTGIAVIQTYGMTEAASQITADWLPHQRGPHYRNGTVGRPVGVSVRVVDENGTAVTAGVAGRVQLSGPSIITAYVTRHGADSFTADGWLDTGDLGALGDDGALQLHGRADDVINRGGEKFSPLHVEEVLLGEPGVAAVSVVGVPDPVLGQVPVAVIIARPGAADGLLDRVRALAEAELDRVRRPTKLYLLDELPGGVNGKVSRREVLKRLTDAGLL